MFIKLIYYEQVLKLMRKIQIKNIFIELNNFWIPEISFKTRTFSEISDIFFKWTFFVSIWRDKLDDVRLDF